MGTGCLIQYDPDSSFMQLKYWFSVRFISLSPNNNTILQE